MSFETTLSKLGIARTTPTPTVAASAKTSLDQSDFLKLMTAQLNNQDPFDPVDNTQMVAQMAQFSSLAGITEMSSTLKAISDKLGATSVGDAVSYVGRTVLTEGSTAYPRTTGGIAGAVELGADATEVNVTIAGADGGVVKTIKLGAAKAGTLAYDWDGTTDAGVAAGDGPYTVSVAAQNGGQSVAATGLVWAPVQSVSTAGGRATLTLPGIGDVDASLVRQIG